MTLSHDLRQRFIVSLVQAASKELSKQLVINLDMLCSFAMSFSDTIAHLVTIKGEDEHAYQKYAESILGICFEDFKILDFHEMSPFIYQFIGANSPNNSVRLSTIKLNFGIQNTFMTAAFILKLLQFIIKIDPFRKHNTHHDAMISNIEKALDKQFHFGQRYQFISRALAHAEDFVPKIEMGKLEYGDTFIALDKLRDRFVFHITKVSTSDFSEPMAEYYSELSMMKKLANEYGYQSNDCDFRLDSFFEAVSRQIIEYNRGKGTLARHSFTALDLRKMALHYIATYPGRYKSELLKYAGCPSTLEQALQMFLGKQEPTARYSPILHPIMIDALQRACLFNLVIHHYDDSKVEKGNYISGALSTFRLGYFKGRYTSWEHDPTLKPTRGLKINFISNVPVHPVGYFKFPTLKNYHEKLPDMKDLKNKFSSCSLK